MINAWLALALLLTAVNWLSVWHSWRVPNLLSKPAVIVAMLAWYFSACGCRTPSAWFAAGLAFSLAGDILLMLPNRFFLYGAAAFMLAHAAYIIGFNQPFPVFDLRAIALFAVFISLMAIVYGVLRRGVKSSPAFRRMISPLAIYSAVISLMVFSALATLFRPDWQPAASGLAASGALLFLFSDILLAADRFIQPYPGARLWKRVAYHLGQLALAAGALIHFSR
ncbi:MAG: lysoplasmalogenase [Anaerolineae bacterium]|nr:lysoplasmalogenase [Anaerolineae bacterium]